MGSKSNKEYSKHNKTTKEYIETALVITSMFQCFIAGLGFVVIPKSGFDYTTILGFLSIIALFPLFFHRLIVRVLI